MRIKKTILKSSLKGNDRIELLDKGQSNAMYQVVRFKRLGLLELLHETTSLKGASKFFRQAMVRG